MSSPEGAATSTVTVAGRQLYTYQNLSCMHFLQELPERLLGTVRFNRLDLAAGWYLEAATERLWRSREEAAEAAKRGVSKSELVETVKTG